MKTLIDATKNEQTVQKLNVATCYKTTVMFNELEQDLLEFIVNKIDRTDKTKNFDEITFDCQTFFEKTGRKQRHYIEIRAALTHIRDTGIWINEESYTSWISSVNCPERTSIFTVEINPTIKKFLGYCSDNYVTYNAIFVYNLRSIYSKKFYPILKSKLMYLKSVSERKGEEKEVYEIEFTLKELKELFSIPDKKYQKYNDFKKRIIYYIYKEVNELTDIEFEFKEKKNGHSIYKLIFELKDNLKNIKKHEQQELDPNNPIYRDFEKAKLRDSLKEEIIGLKHKKQEPKKEEPVKQKDKKEEPKKQDSGYSYKKEKELEKQKQQNKTVPVDEPILVVDTVPIKTEFDEELDKNFKRKLLKNFDNIRIEDLILENKIHFYLDTKDDNKPRVKVYFPESSIQYFLDNKIETRLNNILNPRQTVGDIEAGKIPENEIIPKPFATDGVNQLIYKVILIGVKK